MSKRLRQDELGSVNDLVKELGKLPSSSRVMAEAFGPSVPKSVFGQYPDDPIAAIKSMVTPARKLKAVFVHAGHALAGGNPNLIKVLADRLACDLAGALEHYQFDNIPDIKVSAEVVIPQTKVERLRIAPFSTKHPDREHGSADEVQELVDEFEEGSDLNRLLRAPMFKDETRYSAAIREAINARNLPVYRSTPKGA